MYVEQYEHIGEGILREKKIKHFTRAAKVRLTHSLNPEWKDLYDDLH